MTPLHIEAANVIAPYALAFIVGAIIKKLTTTTKQKRETK